MAELFHSFGLSVQRYVSVARTREEAHRSEKPLLNSFPFELQSPLTLVYLFGDAILGSPLFRLICQIDPLPLISVVIDVKVSIEPYNVKYPTILITHHRFSS